MMTLQHIILYSSLQRGLANIISIRFYLIAFKPFTDVLYYTYMYIRNVIYMKAIAN